MTNKNNCYLLVNVVLVLFLGACASAPFERTGFYGGGEKEAEDAQEQHLQRIEAGNEYYREKAEAEERAQEAREERERQSAKNDTQESNKRAQDNEKEKRETAEKNRKAAEKERREKANRPRSTTLKGAEYFMNNCMYGVGVGNFYSTESDELGFADISIKSDQSGTAVLEIYVNNHTDCDMTLDFALWYGIYSKSNQNPYPNMNFVDSYDVPARKDRRWKLKLYVTERECERGFTFTINGYVHGCK